MGEAERLSALVEFRETPSPRARGDGRGEGRTGVSRRTQIGVLSFLLTLVWAVALFAAFVGGKIGQHPSLTVGLATTGAFCAAASGVLLTLACFPGLAGLKRPYAFAAAAIASWNSPR